MKTHVQKGSYQSYVSANTLFGFKQLDIRMWQVNTNLIRHSFWNVIHDTNKLGIFPIKFYWELSWRIQ